jgi:sugar lactone lactonase YvrE
MSPTSGARAFAKGQGAETIELDRGCFACTLGGADKRTLFLMAAEWSGPASMMSGPRTGKVLTVEARAGRRVAVEVSPLELRAEASVPRSTAT